MVTGKTPTESSIPRGGHRLNVALLVLGLAWSSTAIGQTNGPPSRGVDPEAAFLSENDAAMAKMMAGMAIKPSGDVDRDFVDMMTPHHQGAIDMAIVVLRYGHSEKLRRLAQEIIVTQQQEIAAMRLAVGEPLPPSIASPTTPSAEAGSAMPAGMDMKKEFPQ